LSFSRFGAGCECAVLRIRTAFSTRFVETLWRRGGWRFPAVRLESWNLTTSASSPSGASSYC